jgi:hypothetical protein
VALGDRLAGKEKTLACSQMKLLQYGSRLGCVDGDDTTLLFYRGFIRNMKGAHRLGRRNV